VSRQQKHIETIEKKEYDVVVGHALFFGLFADRL